MNRIFETFQKPKVLLPVVHCLDTIQTQEAVACAFENGADGVFLINQGGMPLENVLTRAMAAPYLVPLSVRVDGMLLVPALLEIMGAVMSRRIGGAA